MASVHVAASDPAGGAEPGAGFEHERAGEVESELDVKNACHFAYRLCE